MIWLSLYMAVVSRSCGGWPKLPLGLAQWFFAAPFSVCVFLVLLPTAPPLWEQYPYYIWVASALAGASAFCGKRMGHGRGISVFEPMKGNPERVEVLILWTQRFVPVWFYKCLVLTLCEFIVWTGIALLNPVALLGAFIRPISYVAGWGIFIWADKTGRIKLRTSDDGKRAYKAIGFMPRPLDRHTSLGEFLTGILSAPWLLFCLFSM